MKKFARGFAALLILAVLLIGAPVVLLAWVGNPWPPGGLVEVQLFTSRALMGLIAVIAWAAWAQMSACILVETVAAIRGIDASRITFATGGQQRLARILITSVAALGLGASTAASASDAQAAAPTQAVTATAHVQHVHHTQHGQHGHKDESQPQGHQVDVEVPSTLWKLAEAHTGDGTRWRELLDLNRGARLADGTTLTNSTQTIPAGTTITLPAGTHSQAPDQAEKVDRGGRTHQKHEKSYTVQPGDTLWDIADERLGDPTRYPELVDASRDTMQPGGQRLVDPDHIEPGWDITIPAQNVDTSRLDTRQKQTGEAEQAHPDKPAPNEPSHNADQSKQRDDQLGDRTDTRREEHAPRLGQPARTRPDTAEQTPNAHKNERATGRTETADDATASSTAPWLLAGLTGGGVLLAGALMIGLQERRRRQFRARRPGRAIPAPDPDLAPVEKSIIAMGSTTAATVEWLDEALRRLAAWAHETDTSMPPVAAVELQEDTVTLHLSGEAHLPVPWTGTPDRLHWNCTTKLEADDLGPATGWVEAPYPLLVTIGHTHDGVMWLLNCEELGSVSITGDPSRGRDLARHLAAQLAVNPWSRQVDLDCIGIAAETTPLSDRIRFHASGPEAEVAVEDTLAAAVGTLERAQAHDTDPSTGRTGQIDEDVWPARMLLVDASDAPDQLNELLKMVAGNPGRTGTSIVLAGDTDAATITLRVTAAGRVQLEHQGLDLSAVGLTADEAHGCALLYAQRNNIVDTDVPVDEDAEGLASHSDRTGALRPEHTRPRAMNGEDAGEPLTTLLERDDAEYTCRAPVTPDDLQALAPRVPARVRTQVEADDPALDDDVAAWFDPDSRRPKLAVLGKVKVTAHGKPLATSKAYCTEVVAYLATEDHRKNGVTRDQVGRAFLLDDPVQVRKYLNMVRGWLGTNPTTGAPHLPNADKSPASKTRGTYVYQLDDGLLVDMNLFRRLRQRGMARGGAEGHRDLSRALELVSGRPFDQQRPNGWSWLVDTGDEHHLTAMIADTALTVTTYYLAERDVDHARAAAEIAALAAPYEETAQMALACVNGAEGNADEAARILRDEIYDRVDEADVPPEDLSERTRAILKNQDWLAS